MAESPDNYFGCCLTDKAKEGKLTTKSKETGCNRHCTSIRGCTSPSVVNLGTEYTTLNQDSDTYED